MLRVGATAIGDDGYVSDQVHRSGGSRDRVLMGQTFVVVLVCPWEPVGVAWLIPVRLRITCRRSGFDASFRSGTV
ncbi:hypothetical protein [Halocatena salina]|uniref:Uncharacterized protein n=1 Tax=Halocatena salina TaxID=2934340 RepID=A0A8U0A0F7_9EURY|nr:hypothetical protein [Halocatena salina]UPM42621.1 hypothetical protein MW046_11735 [Halocatena salina]